MQKLLKIVDDLKRKQKEENEKEAFSKNEYRKELQTFHEPVVKFFDEQFSKQQEQPLALEDIREDIKAIEDKQNEQLQIMNNISQTPQIYNLKVDDGLDEVYLKEKNWPLPSTVLTNPNKVAEVIRVVTQFNRSLGGKMRNRDANKSELAAQIEHNRHYLKSLRTIQTGNIMFNPTLSGAGLLDKLTDNLVKDPNNLAIKADIRKVLNSIKLSPCIRRKFYSVYKL